MRGIPRNIAILLALCLLAVTGVAGRAEARGGGGKLSAAAAKMSRGAQIKLDRMKQKMSLRTRGALQQKTRRQIRLGKKQMMRAMSRREVGLHGSESERTRARFARDIDTPEIMGPGPAQMSGHGEDPTKTIRRGQLEDQRDEQRQDSRKRVKQRAARAFKKIRRGSDD